MSPALCFIVLLSAMLVAATYLFATAREGWEDDQGFHLGVRGHSVHNGRYTND